MRSAYGMIAVEPDVDVGFREWHRAGRLVLRVRRRGGRMRSSAGGDSGTLGSTAERCRRKAGRDQYQRLQFRHGPTHGLIVTRFGVLEVTSSAIFARLGDYYPNRKTDSMDSRFVARAKETCRSRPSEPCSGGCVIAKAGRSRR